MADHWRSQVYVNDQSYFHIPVPLWLQVRVEPLWRESVVARLGRVLADRVPFERVVDLGCANGSWTLAYLKVAKTALGVDVNESFIERAKELQRAHTEGSRVEFRVSGMETFDDFAGADLVGIGGCAQYLTDETLESLFERIANAQRPGNIVYIRTNVTTRGQQRYWTEHGVYRHGDEYERVFERVGYKTLETYRTIEYAPAVVMQRLLPSRSLLPVRALAWPVTAPLRLYRDYTEHADHRNWVLERR